MQSAEILKLLQASYTPLIPLMSELLSKREVNGWKMPMWNMADADSHRKLLLDAGFASIQVDYLAGRTGYNGTNFDSLFATGKFQDHQDWLCNHLPETRHAFSVLFCLHKWADELFMHH